MTLKRDVEDLSFDEGTQLALEKSYDDTSDSIELAKLRISFWEKLVILDASALALSLTAAGFFRGHFIGDGGSGYLLAAWKLLLISCIFAVAAQWSATLEASYFHGRLRNAATKFRLEGIAKKRAHEGRSENKFLREQLLYNRHALRFRGQRADALRRIGHVLGPAAQACTVIAFYWLYRFAHVNLAHLT
jgi:hypothetical protein